MSYMNRVKSTIILSLILLTGCEMFIPYSTSSPQPDGLPWNGPGTRVIEQRKQVPVFMSPTGSRTMVRWKTSFWDKPQSYRYGLLLDSYLLEINWLEQWPSAGTVWYGGPNIETRKPPFKFIMVSVNPVIVLMEPVEENDISIASMQEGRRFLSSKYMKNYIYYDVQNKYVSGMQWIAPELKLGPEPLDLEPGSKIEIEFEGGKLVLEERNGVIYTHRE